MAQHSEKHHHGEHARQWHPHKDWRVWTAVVLMLAAMLGYVLSDNESLQPGAPPQQQVPAAP